MGSQSYLVLALLLFLPCAFAQEAGSEAAEIESGMAACMALPESRQEACVETLFARSPEEQAHDAAMQALWSAYQRETAAALARTGEPRELALAATLDSAARAGVASNGVIEAEALRPEDNAQTRAWRAAAAERAGADVIANLLLSGDGSDDGKALRNAAAGRWASAEPDNLAPLFFGSDGEDGILNAVRQRSRADFHDYELVRWIIQAFSALPPPPQELRESAGGKIGLDEFQAMRAVGIWHAVAIPDLHSILGTCHAYARGASTQRRAACRRLGQVLAEDSSNRLMQSLGVAVLNDTAGTLVEQAEARELRRRLEWQLQQWIRISRQLPNDGTTEFARLLRDPSIGNEQDVIARQLRNAGIALNPPPDWEPPRRE